MGPVFKGRLTYSKGVCMPTDTVFVAEFLSLTTSVSKEDIGVVTEEAVVVLQHLGLRGKHQEEVTKHVSECLQSMLAIHELMLK